MGSGCEPWLDSRNHGSHPLGLWLRRWRGESPKHVFASDEFSDWGALESQWSAVEEEQNAFLENLTEEFSLDVCHTKTSKVCAGNTPLLK